LQSRNGKNGKNGSARAASPRRIPSPEKREPPTDRDKQRQLEALLEFLRANRGFDFTGYKRTTFERRLEKRMQEVGKKTYADYLDHLEVDPAEFARLFDTLLINVTAFYRDRAAWEFIEREIVPRILQSKDNDTPIRAWSAGCASGEEPCTLAMVLSEALGTETFRRRVKIYATDVDEEALSLARQAVYPESSLESVPSDLREKYFQVGKDGFTFRADARRAIIYGRHDLIQDAPISKLDLLVCRNTLMYLNAETQNRVLAGFNFALLPKGFLLLGRAEMMLTRAALFQPVELKHRIFAKTAPRLRDAPLVQAFTVEDEAERRGQPEKKLRHMAFDTGPVAQLMVDREGVLTLVNERARNLLGLTANDLGRPFRDLEVSYRPVELRTPIEQALEQKRTITIPNAERYTRGADPQYLDIHVVPILDGGDAMGVSIVFNDVTQATSLRNELARTNNQLEAASEELQSANEELETTNEELQSANEELETTNEELQSANEELETMNEELQSSNEELQALNDELRERSDDLGRSNIFLESILKGMQGGVVVTDSDFMIQIWNRVSEDMWGLRAEEVLKQPLFALDIGLPLEELRQPLREAMEGVTSESIIGSTNRRGKSFRCRVRCMPCASPDGKQVGVISLMLDADAAT
jgi:two-component system CheB/CheR fusion protein